MGYSHHNGKKKKSLYFPLKYYDIKDLKDLGNKTMMNTKFDTESRIVNWRDIKWIQYRKSQPTSIFVKTNFDDENFREIRVRKKVRGKRGSQNYVESSTIDDSVADLRSKYDIKLPISEAKKRDLLSLCRSGIIPAEFHSYYENLNSNSAVRDALPSPDIQDEDSDHD